MGRAGSGITQEIVDRKRREMLEKTRTEASREKKEAEEKESLTEVNVGLHENRVTLEEMDETVPPIPPNRSRVRAVSWRDERGPDDLHTVRIFSKTSLLSPSGSKSSEFVRRVSLDPMNDLAGLGI